MRESVCGEETLNKIENKDEKGKKKEGHEELKCVQPKGLKPQNIKQKGNMTKSMPMKEKRKPKTWDKNLKLLVYKHLSNLQVASQGRKNIMFYKLPKKMIE